MSLLLLSAFFVCGNAYGQNGLQSQVAQDNLTPSGTKLEYSRYATHYGMIYNETAVSISPSQLPFVVQQPCNAHSYAQGDGWRRNTTDNTVANKWEAVQIKGNSKIKTPVGVVGCDPSAETENGLQNFKTAFVSAANSALISALPLTDCFDMTTGLFNNNVNGPEEGEDIIWFNFDIRPLAGTYQFQLLNNGTNVLLGWALFNVPTANAGPIDGVDAGDCTPDGCGYPTSVSGNCNTLEYSNIRLGPAVHAAASGIVLHRHSRRFAL